jgi:uncharacterized membrane protein
MARHRMTHEAKQRLVHSQLRRTRNPRLARVVERNIATLCEIRQQMEAGRGLRDRVADRVTRWSGSMAFACLHAAWFAGWVIVNLGLTPLRPFDPFPFGLLTMIVSLEAIFLSVFVLVSQNRMQAIADQRADLDLQINLLAEYEVTRTLTLVAAIAERLGLDEARDPELDELERQTSPELVLEEMEKHNGTTTPTTTAAHRASPAATTRSTPAQATPPPKGHR